MSGTKLGPIDLSSDVTLVEASSGKEWYYIRSAWHLVSIWVRLTFGQMYPPRHLVAKNGTKMGPINLSLDVTLVEAYSG